MKPKAAILRIAGWRRWGIAGLLLMGLAAGFGEPAAAACGIAEAPPAAPSRESALRFDRPLYLQVAAKPHELGRRAPVRWPATVTHPVATPKDSRCRVCPPAPDVRVRTDLARITSAQPRAPPALLDKA